MEIATLAVGAGALVLGAVVQAATGFGLGIVAIPLLAGAGLTLPQSVAVAVGAAAVQVSLGLRTSGVPAPWRPNLEVASGQWLGLPLGVWAMASIDAADPQVVRQFVGAAVVVLTTAQLVVHPTPRPRLHLAWGPATGLVAGWIGGAVGMGGPPLVFFGLAHDWDRDRFRTFLWRQFLLGVPMLVAIFAVAFGPRALVYFGVGALGIPLLWLGGEIGLRLSSRWERREILRAASVLLYLVGIRGLLAPYV